MKKWGFAIVAMVVLAAGLYAFQPRVNVMTMSRCGQDSDCIPVQGVCGAWSAINKAYRDEWDAHIRNIAPRADCAPSRQADSATAVCRENRCEAFLQP